jgi:hypothetical protein
MMSGSTPLSLVSPTRAASSEISQPKVHFRNAKVH